MITRDKLINFSDNLIKSRKYLLIFLWIIFIASLSMLGMENINHPKMEIIVFILLSFLGIFCISYYQGHNDKEFYKTVFIVLLLFGIIFSFLVLNNTLKIICFKQWS